MLEGILKGSGENECSVGLLKVSIFSLQKQVFATLVVFLLRKLETNAFFLLLITICDEKYSNSPMQNFSLNLKKI